MPVISCGERNEMEKLTTAGAGDIRVLLADDGEESEPEPLKPAAAAAPKRPRTEQPATPTRWGLIGYGGL
jgi:hypothetical protein